MSLLAVVLAAAAIPAPAAAPEPRTPLRELVGSTLVMRFHGSVLPGYVAEALRERRAAGVILFHENAPSAAAVRRLTAQVRRAGGRRALICMDQEGGAIRIMPWAPPTSDQAYVPDAAAARRHGYSAARALGDVGVNVNLAPVADLNHPGDVMDTRAFPGSPARVGRFVRASVGAYDGTGVAPTLKHFPGLGATDGNTDKVSVTIFRSREAIVREDLPPFRAGVGAGAPAVMLSHALYPSLDPNRIASQSQPIVDGLLRDELGFEGVTMTDSLEAFSVRSRSSIETAALRSMRAGVDVILMTGAGSHIRIQRAFRRKARASATFRARLERARARVTTLQDALRRG